MTEAGESLGRRLAAVGDPPGRQAFARELPERDPPGSRPGERATSERATSEQTTAERERGERLMAGMELPAVLAGSSSGIEFVYRGLDLLAQRYSLSDAAVVVETAEVGRQVFRLGRRPWGERPSGAARRGPPSGLGPVLSKAPGLYTEPPVPDQSVIADFTNLVRVALLLDVARHDASHDPLTGLLNRRSYEMLLEQAVSRNRRYGWPFALILLDMDEFKKVNDQRGHAAGDAALRALGVELRAALRSGDVAARLGGDEFALLILNANSPAVLGPIAQRLGEALERAVPGAQIGFSAGVACFPDDAKDIATLTRVADERLYADKALATRQQQPPSHDPATAAHEDPTDR